MSSVQLHHLQIDLGEFHLRRVDLEVRAGEYFIILGPTGAGKTVLLETIAGLHRPRAGRVLLDGQDVTRRPPERRRVGFVYQDYALFPHLTVAENIAFGLKLRGAAPDELRARVDKIGAQLGITHLFHRRPGTLSGGEQQRAALARALIVEPRLLLMDEPLSALDPETRESIQREIHRLHRQLRTTTIHVTHDFEEAVALGERIAVMHEGRIVQTGTPEEIFRKPASEFVARFVGMRNLFRGTVHRDPHGDTQLHVGDVAINVVTELHGEVHGSIRPEDVVLLHGEIHSSARNVFGGRIVDISDRGPIAYVTVRLHAAARAPLDIVSLITHRSLVDMQLQEGKEIALAFKASAVHVF